MSDREALETLINWFGDKEFLVGLMTPDRVDELAEQLGIEAPEKKTLRDKVGRWLSSNDGLEYVPANNKRFKLEFKNIGLQASVSVIPAKAGTRNPVAGKYAFAANGLWIPAFAGMTVNMTTLPS